MSRLLASAQASSEEVIVEPGGRRPHTTGLAFPGTYAAGAFASAGSSEVLGKAFIGFKLLLGRRRRCSSPQSTRSGTYALRKLRVQSKPGGVRTLIEHILRLGARRAGESASRLARTREGQRLHDGPRPGATVTARTRRDNLSLQPPPPHSLVGLRTWPTVPNGVTTALAVSEV
ncbi:hypothetical protein PsYK624_023170 [Phanerochaete sordida]|uniref:Uncharacterized protein n=1 Tax=Phanerochaete sordida TaxID=48140 RepID=A0A9P3G188_9APHY|nr:hypothetical protein PsYK624_023170 [Phanerochaete sordida]